MKTVKLDEITRQKEPEQGCIHGVKGKENGSKRSQRTTPGRQKACWSSCVTNRPRMEITRADRISAARYNAGTCFSIVGARRKTGIAKGEYARVRVSTLQRTANGRAAGRHRKSYDPRRQQGNSIYREHDLDLSTGYRVQPYISIFRIEAGQP